MFVENRRNLLTGYRKLRETTNTNPAGESTGRTYIPIPDELRSIGTQAHGHKGFVQTFDAMLKYSPVEIRPGELLIGDYYFLLPYEIIPFEIDIDLSEEYFLGAMPVVPCGHTATRIRKGLELGWNGIKQYISKCRESFVDGSPEAEYLNCSLAVVCLIQEHILKYADAADNISQNTTDPDLASEYRDIAQRCRRLASEPPKTFHDALQWFWFYIMFERATSTGMGYDRFDQVFYSYYINDKNSGILDDETAQLLIEALLCKEPLFTSIGGVDTKGNDAVNELTFLTLYAYDEIGGSSNLAFRWHSSIDPQAIKLATGILAMHGTGTPHLANDNVIIPSLVQFGFPIEQAREYSFCGCFWWVVPGKEYPYHDLCAVSGIRALMRAMEMTLNATVSSYEVLWENYCSCMLDSVAAYMRCNSIIDDYVERTYPEMIASLLMDGCLESGTDVNAGGAESAMTTVLYVGLANVADSLAAIRKLVYTDERYTLADIMTAVNQDYDGYQHIRWDLLSVPKYGNDDDTVDTIARDIAIHFKQTLSLFKNNKGFSLRPAFYSWHRHTFEGNSLGATPDGRMAHTPLAHGGNPMHGAAQNGVTAAMSSMSKLDFSDTSGCPFHIHIQEGDIELRNAIVNSLASVAFCDGVPHLIINVVNRKTLIDAMVNPEHHSDLVIRVTGYSAKYVMLDRKLQQEIADRNEF